jgi:hypothetical protein
MSVQEIKTARDLGKAGYAARGVVFGLIGMLILQPSLAAAPKGEILLVWLLWDLFCLGPIRRLCAKWNKIGNTRRSR